MSLDAPCGYRCVVTSSGEALRRISATHVDGRPLRLLVVDDDPGLADALTRTFDYLGWVSRAASSGEEAIAQTAEHRPDLVILDVGLPGLDGFETLQRLRAHAPGVGVIFLSARTELDDRLQGIAVGGDDYITKPFALDEVVLRAWALMRRSGLTRAAQSAVLTIADLTIDTDAHTVTRAGDAIDLTATEYALLRYLARNARRVISKAELVEQVWGYDYGGDAHVVELYISYLRRKLDSGRDPLIHTVRGAGYVLR